MPSAIPLLSAFPNPTFTTPHLDLQRASRQTEVTVTLTHHFLGMYVSTKSPLSFCMFPSNSLEQRGHLRTVHAQLRLGPHPPVTAASWNFLNKWQLCYSTTTPLNVLTQSLAVLFNPCHSDIHLPEALCSRVRPCFPGTCKHVHDHEKYCLVHETTKRRLIFF